MLLDCFTCPYKVVQYGEHLVNGQNQETKLFSETKILLDLKDLGGTKTSMGQPKLKIAKSVSLGQHLR